MFKAMIVDDESWVVENIKASVAWEELGYQVVAQAGDGVEALSLIQALRPDIVLTDIRMRGLTGIELIRRTNELAPGTRFIVISGHAEFAYAHQAINGGALGYILKPLDERELQEQLVKAKETMVSRKQTDRPLLPNPGMPQDQKVNGTMKEIMQYIHVHFRENISISSIANKFYLHPNYVSQLFKQQTGKTFTRHLWELRIHHACELLVGTEFSIQEVAVQSGIEDYFYFNRIFKRLTGCTPVQFRQAKS